MADNRVTVFEVGPRDGLQNEPRPLSLEDRLWFISGLVQAGVKDVEIGAFVRPDRVPQMADTERVYAAVDSGKLNLAKARGWALIPNQKGLERALQCGAKNLAVFTATSEAFNQRNIGMSVSESLKQIAALVPAARKASRKGTLIRAYVSTAFGCPFEGKVPPKKTLKVIESLAKLGVDQISIGDTIGVATPKDVDAVIQPALKIYGRSEGPKRIAVHFHDTRGTALANTLRALELGVRIVDSSAGGLGGCPFAPGATGNLATEDLVFMLDGMGMKTGIDLQLLCKTSLEMAQRMKRPLSSRYLQAFAAACDRTL
ncbi:MAG: hydroxymethylglutaryl-CoA lyase [Bdellovibrionia bacterium]